jgi:hypothetical protein
MTELSLMNQALIDSFIALYERDLDKLTAELQKYIHEENIWVRRDGIANPAGNLCLHLCGNLQHYVGHGIGHSGYVRDRHNEFAARGLSRGQLLQEIATTKAAVVSALRILKPAQLNTPYPEPVFDYPMTHVYFLIHLLAHFGYHLGQINYHRRLIDNPNTR